MNIVDWMPTFLNLAGLLHKFTVNRKLFVRGSQNFIIQLSGGVQLHTPFPHNLEIHNLYASTKLDQSQVSLVKKNPR